MPSASSDGPSVSLSFANNFWGKDDAGVAPLLERMHNAKNTSEELKSFYSARAAIEDEYARKLLSLARKPLGAGEAGTLRMSLDVVRAEVESMGKQHQNVAQQMKSELDESLAAFGGGMKERRKIVQNGIEKLLKLKIQQTSAVNKSRDRYEQDCLKIKGYLAQGHMVMGQEERKNKAKLEKTQINMSTTSSEYEQAVKMLEETTGRWNREWKAACDKFQDLEEERIDFTKSSLWTFANIASTVCVSDDASCEKMRLSLEDCDVEKDIATFIREAGTGQEIPDPPKFIDFCKEDVENAFAEIEQDGNYSVAQFQRNGNPAFRSSTPQPNAVENDLDMPQLQQEFPPRPASATPRKPVPNSSLLEQSRPSSRVHQHQQSVERKDFAVVPHNEYPLDGMTQFCRMGPPSASSSVVSPQRPVSRESQSHSEYSNPTSYTSGEPSLLSLSPSKQLSDLSAVSGPNDDLSPKKSSIFESRSPFRRKSTRQKDQPQRPLINPSTGQRSGYAQPVAPISPMNESSPTRQQLTYNNSSNSMMQLHGQRTGTPEPADPRAQFQLNVGNNVFDVASPDALPSRSQQSNAQKDFDPIAQALADLKNVTKQSSVRQSADRYHGIATPAPDGSHNATPTNARTRANSTVANGTLAAAHRGTPPPMYDQSPSSRLGAPQPAFTSRQMQQTTQKYVEQKQNMFKTSPSRQSNYEQQPSSPQVRSNTQRTDGARSPVPFRSTSPRPGYYEDPRQIVPRSASPNPYTVAAQQSMPLRPRDTSTSPTKPNDTNFRQDMGNGSPAQYKQQSPLQSQYGMTRSASPNPQFNRSAHDRQGSSQSMALQLAPVSQQQHPQHQHGYSLHSQQSQPQLRGRRPSGGNGQRPMSQYNGQGNAQGQGQGPQRMRSRSAAPDGRNASGQGQQMTRDGRPIMHFARAIYLYTAAIPEEVSFAKGDVLAVLRHQDDGWWEAEVTNGPQGRVRRGLAPSNYLTPI